MGERVTRAAGIFATIIGTFKVIGIYSGIWIFGYIGQTFAISPSPSPFSTVSNRHYGDPQRGMLIGCESSSGEIKWAKWEFPMRSATPGPHRRGVSFLSFFRDLRSPTSRGDLARSAILVKYYFCNDGPLARSAGCAPDLSGVIFKDVEDPEAPPKFSKRYSCLR